MKFTTSFTLLVAAIAGASQARVVPVVPRQSTGGNLQPFTGTLGGAATPVLSTGDATRPFSVKGDTFVLLKGALQRSCDQQFNACANQANSGASFSVSDCTNQKTQCTAADANVSA